MEKLPSKPLAVVACEDSDWLVFHVEVKSEEGLKILRLRGDSVTEIEHLLRLKRSSAE